jgi:hypothetical protein
MIVIGANEGNRVVQVYSDTNQKCYLPHSRRTFVRRSRGHDGTTSAKLVSYIPAEYSLQLNRCDNRVRCNREHLRMTFSLVKKTRDDLRVLI